MGGGTLLNKISFTNTNQKFRNINDAPKTFHKANFAGNSWGKGKRTENERLWGVNIVGELGIKRMLFHLNAD